MVNSRSEPSIFILTRSLGLMPHLTSRAHVGVPTDAAIPFVLALVRFDAFAVCLVAFRHVQSATQRAGLLRAMTPKQSHVGVL